MRGRHIFAGIVLLAAIGITAAPSAHEIPASVTVHTFVKPEGHRLTVLVRVPLAAMRDIQFPERLDGSLDSIRGAPLLLDAVAQWILPSIEILESGGRISRPTVLGARVSLPSDRSFSSYETAIAHVTATTPAEDLDVAWQQTLFDVALEYPIASDGSDFAIRPNFARLGLRVVTFLRFVDPRGGRAGTRVFELRGDPGFVRLDPRWHQAAGRFVQLGVLHILDGIDHLLFLLCLVLPLRRIRPLVIVVTAFTVAHSLTLAAAAYGLTPDALWFPPFIEMLIAGSIVYMAIENIVSPNGSMHRRWILAFAFGLAHGFGFSFALSETMQLAGSHMLLSLVSFNAGVELGQIVVLLVLVPALHWLFKLVVSERMGTIVISALVAHTAWHWAEERWDALRQFSWPAADAVTSLGIIRALLAAVAVSAALWLLKRIRMARVSQDATIR